MSYLSAFFLLKLNLLKHKKVKKEKMQSNRQTHKDPVKINTKKEKP